MQTHGAQDWKPWNGAYDGSLLINSWHRLMEGLGKHCNMHIGLLVLHFQQNAGLLHRFLPVTGKCGSYRIVVDVCNEAMQMTKLSPLVASPIKGPLSDLLHLDVEMARNTPFSAALQHLIQCITHPEWLAQADRSSGANFAALPC
jgi:hypothetical protein